MDFVNSARRHGLKPGLYYNLFGNYYLEGLGATAGQRQVTPAESFNITLTHLHELWSNYGDLAELWFDGRAPFGNNVTFQQQVAGLIANLQPNAIALQGPSVVNGARKGNGETCTVHDPNWYLCPSTTA